MAINWAYTPPEDRTTQTINAFRSGENDGVEGAKRTALSKYVPAALQGDRTAVAGIAAADPGMGIDFAKHFAGVDESARKRSLDTLEWLGGSIVRPDGSLIDKPEELQNIKTLALARGLPRDQVEAFTIDQLPALAQASEAARQYMRQGQQDARQGRMDAETMRHNRVAEARAGVRAQGGRPPSGYTWNQDQTALIPLPGGPADPNTKPLTDDQAKAVGFANRLQSANASMEKFGPALTDLKQKLKGGVPIAGNYMVSPEYQQADQAVRDFINAQLRRESGAVISDSEFDNARKQYIPQPGDGPDVLAQKKEARALAFRNMRMTSGRGGASRIEASPATSAPSGGWTIERVK